MYGYKSTNNEPGRVMFRDSRQFVVRQGKKPVNPLTGYTANAFDSHQWLTFAEARQAATRLGGSFNIGFVLTGEDPFFLLDLDHCIANRALSPLAVELCAMFSSCYREVSQGGDGLHIIGQYSGVIPEHRCKNREHHIELYHEKRLISITGDDSAGIAADDVIAPLSGVIEAYFKPEDESGEAPEWGNGPRAGYTCSLTDEQLIQIALHSKTDFARYWSGWTGDDWSSADQSLCNHLAYWTGCDCERMERLFNRSGLVREKWTDREDYRRRTIEKAASGCRDFYRQQAFIEWVDVGERNRPLNTADNLKAVADSVGVSFRYNELKKRAEISYPNVPDWVAKQTLISVCERARLSTNHIDDYVEVLSASNLYSPALDWVISKQWDGVDRLPQLIATLDPEDKKLAAALVKRWLISAIKALIQPTGVAAPGVLVLQGEQGIGKTSWFRSLVNENMDFALEGAYLDPSNKDSVIHCLSYWIVELGELERMSRARNSGDLKAFFTKDSDIFRSPYAHTAKVHPRRTVFIGTVNPRQYLSDETGNRRYLSINCGRALNYKHDLDMQQIWSQVLEMARTGENHHLSANENQLLAVKNSNLLPANEVEDKLSSSYDPLAPRVRAMTVTEILEEMGFFNQNLARISTEKIAKFLNVKGSRRSNGRRIYDMPNMKKG